MIKIMDKFILLETKNNYLLLEIKKYYYDNEEYNKIDRFFVTQRYFGVKKELDFTPIEPFIHPAGSNQDYNNDFLISSSFGNGNNAEPSMLMVNSDDSFTNRFFFKKVNILKESKLPFGPHPRDILETLEIIEEDEAAKLELHIYYSLFKDSDVIAVHKELINKGEMPCHIKRLLSLECPIDSKDLSINTYDGKWTQERNRNSLRLNNGVFINQSLLGTSSHKHNPYLEIKDNKNGDYYAFNIIYSGNYKEIVEINPSEHASVMVGLNDFAFDYLLNPNQSFITPVAIMVKEDSLEEITLQMHNFINKHIVNPMFTYKDRPVLFNSWEGSGMKINEQSLLEMAELCKEVGIELFVIDDGWFKNRNNDHAALGDWVVDKNKFPNGLSPFVNKIKEMGLSFGIWVEPEMISINSDIYRSHPEYALEIPGRTPLERRHQMVIDMSNPDVINYLDDSLSNLFNELKPAYVKWDCNRMISEFYSHIGIRSGELIYRFMMGTYELLERLTKKFPDILFESCASGGGRYDLGMLYYMPQTWGSDNSNANNRCYIACGTLTGYPQSTLGAHISRDYSVDQKRSAFDDRFNINSIGGFGYEFDIRTSPEKELETMKKQIAYFKKHRHLIQFGHYYVIDNCFDDERYYSFNMVSDDQKEAILSAIQTSQTAPKKNWKFKGLNPEYIYEIEMREQDNISLLSFDSKSGKELMENGLDLGLLNEEKDIQDYPNGIQSRMIYIKKVN